MSRLAGRAVLRPPAPIRPRAQSPLRDRCAGRPLAAGVRALLEPRFRQDFSGVRVHDDAAAAGHARSARARAFTVGEDVVFAAGRHDSASPEGLHRLAHELAHVVQYRNGSVSAGAEERAGRAADAAVDGATVEPAALGGRPETLARDPDDGAGARLLGGGLHLRLAGFDGFTAGGADLTAEHQATAGWVGPMLAGWALRDPGARFQIVGRAQPGTADTALALRRARAVAAALLKAGVPASALQPDTDMSAESAPQVEVRVVGGTGAGGGGAATPDLRLHPGAPPVPFLPTPARLPGQAAPPGPTTQPVAGFEPATRPGTTGNLRRAVLQLDPVKTLLDRLEGQVLDDLRRTSTGDRVVLGAGAATFAGTLGFGIAGSTELRRFALDQLNGVVVPLSVLADAHFQLTLPGIQVSIEFDMRRLGPIPNQILRAASVELRTQSPTGPQHPAALPDAGFILHLDLTKLPGIGRRLR